MFELLGYTDNFTPCGITSHGVNRSKRLQVAERLIIKESAKVVKIAVVDKGHKNGNEIHVIFNNGIVKIYNANTCKFITVLIARVPQIERYEIKVTETMRKKINLHIKQGYNHIKFQEVEKMTISEMWDTICEYGIATEEELELVTAINGYNEDTLNYVIYARTGYHDIYQLLDEEQEVKKITGTLALLIVVAGLYFTLQN